ncbi:MAG: hypothetical protein M9942_10390 [Microthrixaceae bacterium]|nr:hypothetical protein [Microthrixaceae bacterium]
MKEDVLEQVVDDYLQLKGYFTTHNLRFRPSADHPDYETQQDSVHSDIDVVGFLPTDRTRRRVVTVTCKSWQAGFDARQKLLQMRGDLSNPKRETWRHFRELWQPKWSQAFRDEVERLTGRTQFTYVVAATKFTGSWSPEQAETEWNADATISTNLAGNRLEFWELSRMWGEVVAAMTHTTANSEIGRLAQLLKAAGLTE